MYGPLRRVVKRIDDTPVDENESDCPACAKLREQLIVTLLALEKRVVRISKRVANLETQRTPQDENDDPEWF